MFSKNFQNNHLSTKTETFKVFIIKMKTPASYIINVSDIYTIKKLMEMILERIEKHEQCKKNNDQQISSE